MSEKELKEFVNVISLKPVSDAEYGYSGLIETFGFEVIDESHDDDYQGDSYYIFKTGQQYGFLSFGWGSCSGCDAYQAAYGNEKELTELRDSLYENIRWFNSYNELADWFQNSDHELNYYGHTKSFNELKERVLDGR